MDYRFLLVYEQFNESSKTKESTTDLCTAPPTSVDEIF